MTTKFLCGSVATWEHRSLFGCITMDGISTCGVFFLRDAQFGDWIQKGWSQTLLCQTTLNSSINNNSTWCLQCRWWQRYVWEWK